MQYYASETISICLDDARIVVYANVYDTIQLIYLMKILFLLTYVIYLYVQFVFTFCLSVFEMLYVGVRHLLCCITSQHKTRNITSVFVARYQ